MSEANSANGIVSLRDVTERQRAMRLTLGCTGHNKQMIVHPQEAGAHHKIQGKGKFETLNVVDVDRNSLPNNAIHQLRAMHEDNDC